MLPFFRKIRWRLAANNQFFKYSRYAIGEIVLVVIGILIALQINNWNEERKNEKKIKKVLSEIQRDILFNLEVIEQVIVAQNFQHSLILAIESDTLEAKDFIEDPRFAWAIQWGGITPIRSTGFDKLKKLEEEISDKYVVLNDSIQLLYNRYETDITSSEKYDQVINENRTWMTNNWKWYSKYFTEVNDGRNEETVGFLINNPFYRNKVHRTKYSIEHQEWLWSRQFSYLMYKMIAKYTGVDELPTQYSDLIETNLEEYSGAYRWKDTIQAGDSRTREIKIIDGVLRYDKDSYIFEYIKKDSFINEYNNTLFFKRDSSDSIVGATRYNQGKFLELEKVN